jgi:hypothetical protein
MNKENLQVVFCFFTIQDHKHPFLFPFQIQICHERQSLGRNNQCCDNSFLERKREKEGNIVILLKRKSLYTGVNFKRQIFFFTFFFFLYSFLSSISMRFRAEVNNPVGLYSKIRFITLIIQINKQSIL